MKTFLLPILLILIMLVAWLSIRSRGPSWRIAGALAAIAALSLVLMDAGVTPLLTGGHVPDGPEGHWLRCVGILWWVVAAQMSAAGVRLLLERDALSREARITADLLSGLIYLATLLVVLDFVLLLPVGGLVATSGIVAVVIGLALQNTLADVFSGIAVGIERPFGAGDRITLADGVEGIVIEINWRSIRIQTDGEDIATIPNSVVAKAQILNRNVPTKRRSAHVLVTLPTAEKPELVLEIVRRAAMLCPAILTSPAPNASMTRLGVHTNTFAIDYFVSETSMIAASRTALLSHAHRQLRVEGLIRTRASEKRHAPDVMAVLEEAPIFAVLSVEHRGMLAASVRRRAVHAGDMIFARGEEADHLIVVAAGVIDVIDDADDLPSSRFRRAGPGDVVGDVGLLEGVARGYSARAESDGLLLILSRTDILALIDQDEGLAAELERSAARHSAALHRSPEGGGVAAPHMPYFLETLRHRVQSLVDRASCPAS